MFYGIKNIVFKIKLLTFVLLFRSFGDIVHDIAANSNGLLSVSNIRSLEKRYKKRSKALLDVNVLKNCKVFDAFPNFIHG